MYYVAISQYQTTTDCRIRKTNTIKKVQAEKALTRQKILLGSFFFLDMLENNKLEGIREYTANNLDKHLTRNADKELLAPVIDNVKKLVKGLSLVKPIENNYRANHG